MQIADLGLKSAVEENPEFIGCCRINHCIDYNRLTSSGACPTASGLSWFWLEFIYGGSLEYTRLGTC